MGRRAKDKQLVAQATRRRTVLQIDRVSRRETGEGPSSSGPARAINPNSISGIGLLGSYADDSDGEEEGDYDASEDQSGPSILEEESAVASSSSVGPQPEIDAKLADFFNEIASMDADTTTVTDDRKTNRQAEEVVSSTTEDEAVYQQGGDYSANEANLYPWHPCLDETTNCYYYWNVETNEVQWEPPPQLLAVADAQTTNDSKVIEEDSNVEFEHKKEEERQEDEESMYQRNENFDTYKELENEENQDNASENDDKQANSKGNTDDEIDGYELLEFKEEEQQAECVEKKEASTRKSDVIFTDDDIPAKKPKLLAAESDDSDDDFATQLLEDTYDHGKQDVVREKKMDLPDEEDKEMKQGNVAKDEETESEKPLLPPEVFEHLKNSETGEKKEDKLIIEEKAPRYDVEEAEYKQQIMELTSVLTNKLDFLEISRKDVTSLKILLIEMETRISDWREGALDSRHFINKLCEADAQLKQYEESAAPPGWTCHWDRYCISLVLCPGG